MNKDLIVSDFAFSSLEEADSARVELEKIEKLNEKNVESDISLLYKVYVKSIEKNTFKTPVGLSYLYKIKKILDEDGTYETVPVPVNNSLASRTSKEQKNEISILTSQINSKKKMFNWSLFVNFVLIVLVILMFYISSTSSSPNIINYQNVILDKYSAWEQELNEREQILNERESMLNN